MADYWVARESTILWGQSTVGKSLLDVFNGAGSGRIVRAYFFYAFNNHPVSNNGDLLGLAVRRTTGTFGPQLLTGICRPIGYDRFSSVLPDQITAGYRRFVTATDTFRSALPTSTTPRTSATGSRGHNNILTHVPYAEWARYGVDNTDLEPIVCRESQGCDMAQTTQGAVFNEVCSIDCEIIFTAEAS